MFEIFSSKEGLIMKGAVNYYVRIFFFSNQNKVYALIKLFCKGVYIRYIGAGDGGFYKFFKKYFLASLKNFMVPPINFSFSVKSCLSQYFRVGNIHRMIQSTKKSISLYSVPMRENVGKKRTRITPNADGFYAVKKR